MTLGRRLSLEYAVLLSTIIIGIVLGSQHPVTDLQRAHPAQHMFSIFWLFSGNTVIILGMLLSSVFTGGVVGVLVLFVNALLYGSFLSIYNHDSLWSSIFPWMEIIALMIAIQVGADVFWSLLLKWSLHPRLIVVSIGISILLLMIAASIEGGVLNV